MEKLRKFTGKLPYYVLAVWCTNVKNLDQFKCGHDFVGQAYVKIWPSLHRNTTKVCKTIKQD